MAGAMPRGVLRAEQAAQRFTLARLDPSARLAPFVEYHWIVRWDLRGLPDYEQAVLPHPNVHLVFEGGHGGAGIFGVDRSLFTRRLSGLGKGHGVRFRPGGFRPFWGRPVSSLTDKVTPATELFGPAAEDTRTLIMKAGTDAEMVAHAEELLSGFLPSPDPAVVLAMEQAAALVDLIVDDPGLRRVDQLALAAGLTVRGVQRLFAEYVGCSPKWVMRRARLHEAAQRADSGEPVDWGQLAADLGYADQAHLSRDFTATLGVSPTRYQRA